MDGAMFPEGDQCMDETAKICSCSVPIRPDFMKEPIRRPCHRLMRSVL